MSPGRLNGRIVRRNICGQLAEVAAAAFKVKRDLLDARFQRQYHEVWLRDDIRRRLAVPALHHQVVKQHGA